jgi:hypothetical protein
MDISAFARLLPAQTNRRALFTPFLQAFADLSHLNSTQRYTPSNPQAPFRVSEPVGPSFQRPPKAGCGTLRYLVPFLETSALIHMNPF